MSATTTAEQDRADLVGRRIVRVTGYGDELQELVLDDGTVIRFAWQVGSEHTRVGLRVERRARGTGGGIC